MLPPREEQRTPSEELTSPFAAAPPSERWSVRLELGDADIAKLYGQGMTRGAVVWRKGMMEWRPLLVTPELNGVLRRSRTTVAPTLPPLPSWVDAPPALPLPPRVPTSTLPPGLDVGVATPTTVAPTAQDVEPPRNGRRRFELAAVALAAFVAAWITHGLLKTQDAPDAASGALPASLAAAAATPAACEPPKSEPSQTGASGSTIPTVSVADLPLAGGRGAAVSAGGPVAVAAHALSPSPARTTGSEGGSTAPSRVDLMNALGGVARAASSCGERGGPVRIVLSFASSGVARSIRVAGDDLPPATRSCIIGAASRARVPAFTGDPVTVSKTL
jgi:hypothetical protein